MLKPSEKADVARKLSAFFKTYHSTKSIEPAAQVYFVEDAAEFSMEAIEAAIKRFRLGQVPERNNAFAPSVAEFINEVSIQHEAIGIREFWKQTDWLVEGSAEYRGICEAKGVKSLPSVEYKGPVIALRGTNGWYVDKEKTKAAAPLIAKHRKEIARIERRGPLKLETRGR